MISVGGKLPCFNGPSGHSLHVSLWCRSSKDNSVLGGVCRTISGRDMVMPRSASQARPGALCHVQFPALQRLWAVWTGSKRGPWKLEEDTEPVLCGKTEAAMSPPPGESGAAGDLNRVLQYLNDSFREDGGSLFTSATQRGQQVMGISWSGRGFILTEKSIFFLVQEHLFTAITSSGTW